MKNITKVFKIRNIKTKEFSEGTWFSEKSLERAVTRSYKWVYEDWTNLEIVVFDLSENSSYPLTKFKSKVERLNVNSVIDMLKNRL